MHHVAKLASERELAFAIDDRDFRRENRSANFSPGEAGDQADFALLVGERVAELRNPEEIRDIFGCDLDRVFQTFLHYAPSDLAANIADFALQVADTSFPCV